MFWVWVWVWVQIQEMFVGSIKIVKLNRLIPECFERSHNITWFEPVSRLMHLHSLFSNLYPFLVIILHVGKRGLFLGFSSFIVGD